MKNDVIRWSNEHKKRMKNMQIFVDSFVDGRNRVLSSPIEKNAQTLGKMRIRCGTRIPLPGTTRTKISPISGAFFMLCDSNVDNLLTVDFYFVLLYSAVLMPSRAPISVQTTAAVFAIASA